MTPSQTLLLINGTIAKNISFSKGGNEFLSECKPGQTLGKIFEKQGELLSAGSLLSKGREKNIPVWGNCMTFLFKNLVCFFQYAAYFHLTSSQDSCYQPRHSNCPRTFSNKWACFSLSLKEKEMSFSSFFAGSGCMQEYTWVHHYCRSVNTR